MSILGDPNEARGSIHSALNQNEDENEFSQVLEELKAGAEALKNIGLLMEVVKQKASGAPIDDKTLLMERMIQLVSALPEASIARKKLSGVLTKDLWDSLQHPPLSYLGNKYKYRQPDGSHNNIMYPDLGKANTPYARTVRTETMQSGAKPDPGLIFDLLMARGDKFRPNAAGLSSMLFYHASIITHDVFHTSRTDDEYSDTSSYLDLAPLYGSSQEAQDKIRTGVDGLLKPDTFSEKRLLGFPPGVNVLLIMYSRFHNYVARTLATINEGGRFTLNPRLPHEEAVKKRDNDIFQVARLVTGGLYVNICVHDYVRGIINMPSTESTWTLDPRKEVSEIFDKAGLPRGVGNQVSCEFNLIYRFHPAISNRDAQWTKDFYAQVFPGQDLLNLTVPELMAGILRYEESIPKDPAMRTFAGLKRKEDGTFDDGELVKILKEAIEEPAGAFGANHVPDIMRTIEILGMKQSRKWCVASLNEFRAFFHLKKHETFEDINPDPYVADNLRKLYGHPDNVEMYPGLYLESAKPAMVPGMGICAPYTIGRAVLSDAVTLIRGDRYLTLDYTPANLTNWGITEVASDLKTLGGCKMHHLILNAFPRHFRFNSVYAMQPFYTPKRSREIFKSFGQEDLYSFDPPSIAPPTIPIMTHAGLKTVLGDQKNFKVPWGGRVACLDKLMLTGDSEATTAQRKLFSRALCFEGLSGIIQLYMDRLMNRLLKKEAVKLGRGQLHQVDIVKDIGNMAGVHFAAALCYLPLNTDGYTDHSLYKVITDLIGYAFADTDPTKSWARRRDAVKGSTKLCDVMEERVKDIPELETPTDRPDDESPIAWLRGFAHQRLAARIEQIKEFAGIPPADTVIDTLEEYGQNLGRIFQASGMTPREVGEILVGIAGGIMPSVGTHMAQLIDFYLLDENKKHWAEIQRLTKENTPEADEILGKYALEGTRLSTSLGVLRRVVPDGGRETVEIEQAGQKITAKKGDMIFVSFVAASRDPATFPNPLEIRLDRPRDAYIAFGDGPHGCLGKEIIVLLNVSFLKALANLKNLRRAPGDEGQLKYIPKAGGAKIYLTPDWAKTTPYPTTMKLMFDGPV